jgi:hypothetical protein
VRILRVHAWRKTACCGERVGWLDFSELMAEVSGADFGKWFVRMIVDFVGVHCAVVGTWYEEDLPKWLGLSNSLPYSYTRATIWWCCAAPRHWLGKELATAAAKVPKPQT